MKDGYCIQSDLIEMRIKDMTRDLSAVSAMTMAEAAEKTSEAFESLSHASEFVLGYMKCMARVISCYELDRAYFMAGGLSDLALMRGQPF